MIKADTWKTTMVSAFFLRVFIADLPKSNKNTCSEQVLPLTAVQPPERHIINAICKQMAFIYVFSRIIKRRKQKLLVTIV